MAYSTYLATVPELDVRHIKNDSLTQVGTRRVVSVSHLIAYWVDVQPLGRLLGEAIDGGCKLSDELWHPLQPPTYHPPTSVQWLLSSLSEAWKHVTIRYSFPEDDWYRIEIEKVLGVFRDAANRGHCVVKMLQGTRSVPPKSKF